MEETKSWRWSGASRHQGKAYVCQQLEHNAWPSLQSDQAAEVGWATGVGIGMDG